MDHVFDNRCAITFSRHGNAIRILATIAFHGGTARQQELVRQGMIQVWNQQNMTLGVRVLPRTAAAAHLVVRMIDQPGRSSVLGYPFMRAAAITLRLRTRSGLPLSDKRLKMLAAHEFGHVMGLADRYSQRTMKPLPGFEHHLMADSGGVWIDTSRLHPGWLTRLGRGLVNLALAGTGEAGRWVKRLFARAHRQRARRRDD